eukprot:80357_1
MKYPSLFWSTFTATVIICIVIIRFITVFWFGLQKATIPNHLKILAILYASTLLIRFMFSMASYVKFNGDAVSIIGSCIGYFNGFLLYVFLLAWLLATFNHTDYEIAKWKAHIYIVICLLNLMFGLFLTIERYEIAEWKIENQVTMLLIYGIVYLILVIWLIYAFNARLCTLILSHGSMLNEDNEILLIKAQIFIMSVILVLNLVDLLSDMFALFVPDRYNHNNWRYVRLIMGVFRVILIYLLLRYRLSVHTRRSVSASVSYDAFELVHNK